MEENLSNVLRFQIERTCLNLAKQCLFLLEENRDYSIKLEKLIQEVGLEATEKAQEKFRKDRGRVLSLANSSIKDLKDLLDQVDNNI